MRASTQAHDLVADLLEYPAAHGADAIAATATAVGLLVPEIREQTLRTPSAGHHGDVRRLGGQRVPQHRGGVGSVVVAEHHRVT